MRISNLEIKNNLIHRIKENYQNRHQVETQLATGKRYQLPSQNPVAAINSVYDRVRLNQIDQFDRNIKDTKGYVDVSHTKIAHTVNLMHRVRELAVLGANGSYRLEDRQAMAVEVEELLKEIIATANSRYKDDYLFAGSKVDLEPFRVSMTSRDGLDKPVVERVDYLGNNREITRDIDLDDKVNVGLSGNVLFWGENDLIVSLSDARAYVADRDQRIRIDGQKVEIAAGDNLDAVIDRINRDVPSVRASKQELPDGRLAFSLESRSPHQLHLEDLEGGTVLRSLGILRQGDEGDQPPQNIHPNTIRSGGSVFDVLIRFRDSLLNDRVENIGGRDLGSITESMNHILENQARISAVQTRMMESEKRLALEKTHTLERLAHNEDMDIAEASIDFHQLANIHRISLMTAAKMTQPTLMDYLR